MHVNEYERSYNKKKRKLPPHAESMEPRRARARFEDQDARHAEDCIENTSRAKMRTVLYHLNVKTAASALCNQRLLLCN